MKPTVEELARAVRAMRLAHDDYLSNPSVANVDAYVVAVQSVNVMLAAILDQGEKL